MIDLSSYLFFLKATWIARATKCNRPWSDLTKFYLNKIVSLDILGKMSFQDIDPFPILKQLPCFYQQVMLAHCKSINPLLENQQDFFDQIIFGNRLLNLRTNYLIALNIIYVKDVLSIAGEYNPNIYQQLISKTHYYSDISFLKKSLTPFINHFCTIPFGNRGNEENSLEIYHLKVKKYNLSMKIQK